MHKVVTRTWKAKDLKGTPMFILMQKLKRVKAALKGLASEMKKRKELHFFSYFQAAWGHSIETARIPIGC